MGDICFYDLVPPRDIKHYYQVLNEITEWIVENHERPMNYSFLHELMITCREIAQQEVKIDWPLLKKFANRDQKAMYLAKFVGTVRMLSITTYLEQKQVAWGYTKGHFLS